MSAPKNSSARPRGLSARVKKLLGMFNGDDHVLILIAADPDALGSALAFKRLLWRRVAGVTIASISEISRPDNQAMIRLLQIPMEPIEKIDPRAFSKKVMVDSQPHHSPRFPEPPYDVIIDHHPPIDKQQAEYEDIRPTYGATSSILTEYLQGARINLSQRLATALLYGIKTDTDSFGRPALQEDIKAFQFLYAKASQSTLRKIEFSEMRIEDLQPLQDALKSFVMRGHRLFVHLGQVASADNLVQIADFFLRVATVDACAVSGVVGQKVVVIFRNAAPRLNAGKMAQKAFGRLGAAGGHRAMARAEVPLTAITSQFPGLDHDKLGLRIRQMIQFPNAQKRTPRPE